MRTGWKGPGLGFCLALAACTGQVQLPGGTGSAPFLPGAGPSQAAVPTSLAITSFTCQRAQTHPLEVRCTWQIQTPTPSALQCALTSSSTLASCPLQGELVRRFDAKGTHSLTLRAEDGATRQESTTTVDVGGGWSIATFLANPANGFRPVDVDFQWTVDGILFPITCELDVGANGSVERSLQDCAMGQAPMRFETEGTFPVRLRMNDGAGTTEERTVNVVVRPPPPDLRFVRAEWAQTLVKQGLKLVPGKPAVLLTTVVSDLPGISAPEVRARAIIGGTEVGILRLSGPSLVPTADSPEVVQKYRGLLPAAWIQPGVTIEVRIDPAGTLDEKDELNNLMSLAPSIGIGTVLPLTIVPVIHQGNRATIPAFRDALYKTWPLQDIDVVQRAPYTFGGTLSANDGAAWDRLLSELASLRIADGSPRYYYGFVRVGYGNGIGGIGYVGTPVAVGRDNARTVETITHELGHNFGRQHTPCGAPAGVDLAFPYAGGRTGILGYDLVELTFQPATTFDLMGYCNPTWISDYTYEGAQAYLERNRPVAVSPTALSRSPTPSLLLSGRVTAGGAVELGPLHRLEAIPTQSESGPYRLRVTGTQGVAELRFASDRPAESGVEHFSLLLPDVGDVLELQLWREQTLLLSRLNGTVAIAQALARAAQSAAQDALSAVERAGILNVTWDAAVSPSVMVTHVGDVRTTLALSLNGGSASLSLEGLPPGGTFEISLANGLSSTRFSVPRR